MTDILTHMCPKLSESYSNFWHFKTQFIALWREVWNADYVNNWNFYLEGVWLTRICKEGQVRFLSLGLPIYGKKGKAIPVHSSYRLRGFQEVEASRFSDSWHMKVVKLSALHTDRLYHPGNISIIHFGLRLSRSQNHSAAGRDMWRKNSNYIIGNRTRSVSHPTAPPRAPFSYGAV